MSINAGFSVKVSSFRVQFRDVYRVSHFPHITRITPMSNNRHSVQKSVNNHAEFSKFFPTLSLIKIKNNFEGVLFKNIQ